MNPKQFNYGPFYNRFDSEGRIVLGSIPEPSDDNVKRINTYVPPQGPTIIKQLHTEPDGTITCGAGISDTLPELWSTEDFTVNNILSFLYPPNTWPSYTINSDEEIIWTPDWLGNTAFGKTLSTCHKLANDFILAPEKFVFPEKKFFLYQDIYDQCRSFYQKTCELTSGLQLNKDSYEVQLKCTNFDCTPKTFTHEDNSRDQIFEIIINNVNFGVEVFSKEKQILAQPITTYLSENSDAIALMMPVFERLKQLYAMMYASKELHSLGYIMPETILENHKQFLKQLS